MEHLLDTTLFLWVLLTMPLWLCGIIWAACSIADRRRWARLSPEARRRIVECHPDWPWPPTPGEW